MFKKVIYYFIKRDELDLKHKLANTLLLTASLIQIPTIIVTALMSDGFLGFLPNLLLYAVTIGMLAVVNRNIHSDIPIIIFTSITVLIFFPYMFISEGGYSSGMPIWMTMGFLFVWLLLEGWLRYLIYGLGLLEMVALILYEYMRPEKIAKIPTEGLRMVDITVAVILATLVMGVVICFQIRTYKRQSKEIEDALAEVERANQAKSDFLARVSHEIRTPINAVLGMNEAIMHSNVSGEVLHYSENIDSASHTLLSLVNDILDISKIESGKVDLIPCEYDTFTLFNDCYNMVSVKAADKGLNLTFGNNPDMPTTLYGDEIRIRQIVVNLLNNAVKYTRKGHVMLKADYEPIGDGRIFLKIAVMDSGIGIAKENISKLFDSFTRVDEKKNRNIEGSGLGLSIVKQLVDLMGGKITVSSEESIGSTFVVEIPQQVINSKSVGLLNEKIGSSAQGEHEVIEEFTAHEARILAVDDVDMNLEVIESMIRPTKAQLDMVTSGEECLSIVSSKQYDLILLDHMMPGLDGIETFERIKRDRNGLNADTPVIILTANAIVGAKDEYLKLGFTDYLAKPVSSMDLYKTMLEYLPDELIEKNYGGSGLFGSNLAADSIKTGEDAVLDNLSFLDLDKAIENCAGSKERFVGIIKGIIEKNLIGSLEKSYEEKDWSNYYINMHGTKSTLRLIACPVLPENAQELETAAKEGNEDYLKENHARFIADYKDLISCFRRAVDQERAMK